MASFGNLPPRNTIHASPQPPDATAAPQVLLGPSSSMAVLWARIQRVAPYFRTALLTGESGSGQEAVARALHQLSPLSGSPFQALSATDAESLLAHNPAPSTFPQGMLYLPEPDRLSHPSQATLLRLLRERGSHTPRLVTFAERGLRSLISACGFSADLANSLGALQIEVPPLRERLEDLPHLTQFLLHHLAESLTLPTPQLDPTFLEAASTVPWPTNLTHLQAALSWLLAHGAPNILCASDLDAALAALAQNTAPATPEPRLVRLDQIIREQVQAVLLACNGNKLRAAEILGISRSTLYRMLDSLPGTESHHARG